ncbi:MAG: Gfo/Idh/MocA family protein [Actinomycetota bacterium]
MTSTTIALCGAGMISGVHAAAARTLGFPLVAVASRTPTRSATRAAEWGCRAVTYEDLPNRADVVIVASPPGSHYDHAAHALERGAAVIVEKPLVTTLRDADRLCVLGDRYPHRLLYAENLIFAPSVRRMLALVPEIGSLSHLSLRTVQSRPTWGGFLEPDWGGGVLFDLGVHPLALAVLIGRRCGAGEIVGVEARLHGDEVDTDAHVTIHFANGVRASLHVSWEGPEIPSWDVQLASASSVLRLELLPTVSLEHDGESLDLATEPHGLVQHLGYVDQLRLGLEAFRRAQPSPSDAHFGRWILEIVSACYVSASRHGERVDVPTGCDRSLTPHALWRG